MFAIHQSELLRKTGTEKSLIELLSLLMDGNAILFQSINFLHGSEQHSHSDSIHMTTYPLGGLLGLWIALEDIHADNGPLHYYPGSHKLPYYLNEDYGNEGNFLLLGKKDYDEYEDFIRQRIETLGLKKEILCIPKGTMMIWHANLFHGENCTSINLKPGSLLYFIISMRAVFVIMRLHSVRLYCVPD